MIPLVKTIRASCRSLARQERGVALIEMAVIAPVLILFSIGGFEISRMVSRQNELQSAIADAESIALAANAGASTDTTELKAILMKTLSLDEDQVDVTKRYRCDADTALVPAATDCGTDAVVSSYVQIQLRDVYTPIWNKLGVSGPVNYDVDRMVQLS